MLNQIITFWERAEHTVFPPIDGLFSACHRVEKLATMIDFESLEPRERITIVLAMVAAKEAIEKALPKAGVTDASEQGVWQFMKRCHGIEH
jgi:hypothetical protein